ncbi:hypothetical protein ACLB2K_071302 [Fragaria x ananassa]
MGKAWFLLTKLHSLAWPGLTLAYPLYASLMAMEGGNTSKPDVQQWLAYWIMYALLSPLEMLLQPLLQQWIPFWYDLKLVLVAWLVLPQFGGACFLYEKFVRDHALRLVGRRDHPRHQAAILEPSQPLRRGMPNARNTSTHDQSDTDSRRDTFTRQPDTVNVQDRGGLSRTEERLKQDFPTLTDNISVRIFETIYRTLMNGHRISVRPDNIRETFEVLKMLQSFPPLEPPLYPALVRPVSRRSRGRRRGKSLQRAHFVHGLNRYFNIVTTGTYRILVVLQDPVMFMIHLEYISMLAYSLAISKNERRNLFLVLFDYVLHQSNEASIATGGTEYSDDEIQPLVALLTMADASEAIYICIKLGLTGIEELMKNSISDAVSRYPNSERLNMLLLAWTEVYGLMSSRGSPVVTLPLRLSLWSKVSFVCDHRGYFIDL